MYSTFRFQEKGEILGAHARQQIAAHIAAADEVGRGFGGGFSLGRLLTVGG